MRVVLGYRISVYFLAFLERCFICAAICVDIDHKITTFGRQDEVRVSCTSILHRVFERIPLHDMFLYGMVFDMSITMTFHIENWELRSTEFVMDSSGYVIQLVGSLALFRFRFGCWWWTAFLFAPLHRL